MPSELSANRHPRKKYLYGHVASYSRPMELPRKENNNVVRCFSFSQDHCVFIRLPVLLRFRPDKYVLVSIRLLAFCQFSCFSFRPMNCVSTLLQLLPRLLHHYSMHLCCSFRPGIDVLICSPFFFFCNNFMLQLTS